MSRRFHKKSRNGCAQCKKRHVKCDESHPTCANCSTSELSCSFLSQTAVSTMPNPSSHGRSPFPSSLRGSTMTGGDSPGLLTPQALELHPVVLSPVNMHHLELFHHLTCQGSGLLGVDSTPTPAAFQAVTQSALSAPYLMNEMLALAALHLSSLRPTQHSLYRRLAADLQTRALSLFSEMDCVVNAENCMPMFLFSSFLGLHVLADHVLSQDENSDSFLDKYIGYLYIHRGVRTVTSSSWDILRQTELQPILEAGQTARQTNEQGSPECDRLRLLVEAADLGPSSNKAYQEAIEHLQQACDMTSETPGTTPSPEFVFAWPVVIPVEYTELLTQRRPEALIILAHYAVLLHHRRELWIIGNSGQMLIHSITKHLGQYWESWLAWPNSVVNSTSNT